MDAFNLFCFAEKLSLYQLTNNEETLSKALIESCMTQLAYFGLCISVFYVKEVIKLRQPEHLPLLSSDVTSKVPTPPPRRRKRHSISLHEDIQHLRESVKSIKEEDLLQMKLRLSGLNQRNEIRKQRFSLPDLNSRSWWGTGAGADLSDRLGLSYLRNCFRTATRSLSADGSHT